MSAHGTGIATATTVFHFNFPGTRTRGKVGRLYCTRYCISCLQKPWLRPVARRFGDSRAHYAILLLCDDFCVMTLPSFQLANSRFTDLRSPFHSSLIAASPPTQSPQQSQRQRLREIKTKRKALLSCSRNEQTSTHPRMTHLRRTSSRRMMGQTRVSRCM